MNSVQASKLLSQIDATIVDISRVSGTNIHADSFFAQFFVVYVCGLYEEIIETIFIDFVSRHASQSEIISYARTTIDRSFRNPDSNKLIELVKIFDNPGWLVSIQSLKNEKIALDSIVTNKNNIAHGQGSTITLTDAIQFYKDSRPLIEKFDALLI